MTGKVNGTLPAARECVPLPRPVYPKSILMVTRRCTQRQFLLRPDKRTNNAVIYCLAVAAQRFNIDVIGFVQMSNHLHEVIYDRDGNAPAFYEHFHKLLAKCMNALRGRRENFFASEQASVVRLADHGALLDKLTYVVTNPVKDDLVARVHHWPGAHGYIALLTGRPLRATRPGYFSDEAGTMADEVTLHVKVPPELDPCESLIVALKERVTAFERAKEQERARRGARVAGPAAVRSQPWHASPHTRERRRGVRPTVATRNRWLRIETLLRDRAFLRAYREAFRALATRCPIPFPAGTYQLRRLLNVDVHPFEN